MNSNPPSISAIASFKHNTSFVSRLSTIRRHKSPLNAGQPSQAAAALQARPAPDPLQSFTCDQRQPATQEVERALADATSQALAVVTVTASTPAQSPQPVVVTQLEGDLANTRLARSDSLKSFGSLASLVVAAPDSHPRPVRAILRNRLHPGGPHPVQEPSPAGPQPGSSRTVAYGGAVAGKRNSDGKCSGAL